MWLIDTYVFEGCSNLKTINYKGECAYDYLNEHKSWISISDEVKINLI